LKNIRSHALRNRNLENLQKAWACWDNNRSTYNPRNFFKVKELPIDPTNGNQKKCSGDKVALISSQKCERMAPFLTFCGATLVFEIGVPTFFLIDYGASDLANGIDQSCCTYNVLNIRGNFAGRNSINLRSLLAIVLWFSAPSLALKN
jgi:hypothetical protein